MAKSLPSFYSFLESWVFEDEGASSASLERAYQEPLEKSDLVIFVLGADISAPVLAEIDIALRFNKRILLILRRKSHTEIEFFLPLDETKLRVPLTY